MLTRKTTYNLERLKAATKALKLSEQWMLQVQEAAADLCAGLFFVFSWTHTQTHTVFSHDF